VKGGVEMGENGKWVGGVWGRNSKRELCYGDVSAIGGCFGNILNSSGIF
jgi:hypothetical protein